MKAVDIPEKFSIPFAKNAAGAFIRAIPVTTATPGAASLDQGFPPLTAIPVASGGIPPNIQDINGLLQQSTAWDRWQAAGGSSPQWDSAFSALIGGYPKGAIVASVTNFGQLWLCTVDDNVTNPDSSGAGWYGFYVNKGPTSTVLHSGSGNYTPPVGCVRFAIRMMGGGGGGGGGGTGGVPGSTGTIGTASSFGTITALAGSPGSGGGISGVGVGGPGGTSGAGAVKLRRSGAWGSVGNSVVTSSGNFGSGGAGGSGPFGGAGSCVSFTSVDAVPNSGSGGAGGASNTANGFGGGGAGCGEYVEANFNFPFSAPFAYVVGAAGGGGAAGNGAVGSNGASGTIEIDEYYSN